jgi:hypothetical protein
MDLNPLVDELRAQMALAWPETLGGAGGGIVQAEMIDEIPFADTALPFAVIMVPPGREVDGAGDALSYEHDLRLYYVQALEGEGDPVRTKLKTLAALLWPADPLTYGQVMSCAPPDVSNGLDANQLLADSNLTARAGCLVVTVLAEMYAH